MKINDFIVSGDSLRSLTDELLKRLENISLKNEMFIYFLEEKFREYAHNKNLLKYYIWLFVKLNFTYVPDKVFVNDKKGFRDYEVLIAPYILIDMQQGDCDDFALFIKTALSYFKIESKYILFFSDTSSHIAVTSEGIILDGTNNFYNQFPEGYNKTKILGI